jgi:hypothetical protein
MGHEEGRSRSGRPSRCRGLRGATDQASESGGGDTSPNSRSSGVAADLTEVLVEVDELVALLDPVVGT